MAKSFDLSNMSLDEIESVINSIDPYDPAEPPQFEQDKREPVIKKTYTVEEMEQLGFFGKPPKEVTINEAFTPPRLEEIDLSVLAFVAAAGRQTEKVMWKSFGAASWAFQRITAGIATPATALVRTMAPIERELIRMSVENQYYEERPAPGQWRRMPLTNENDPLQARSRYHAMVKERLGPHTKQMLGDNLDAVIDGVIRKSDNGENMKAALAESSFMAQDIIPAFQTGLKSFVPFTSNDPEKVKNFNDFWAGYYIGLTGEEPPPGYAQVAGMATDFLITPWVMSKFLQAGRVGWRVTPIAKKIASYKLPDWETAKLVRKGEIFERNERAVNLGNALADKDAQRIANQLSIQTGKNITPEAVKLRLGQIIKGSITKQEELAAAANPVIDELTHNFKELQKLGIIGEETYITKLTKARQAEFAATRAKLAGRLERLETAPHYARKGGEISARFPGRADRIAELQTQVAAIDRRLYESDIAAGGEMYMPRMYTGKEAEVAEKAIFPIKGGPKVRAPYAKRREAIPIEVRKAMGEIVEPAYPVTKRLIQENIDIETAKLFDFAARRGDWVSSVPREGLYPKPIPDGKVYGALAGKYVKPSIYHDIQDITYIKNNFELIYDSFIGAWKLGKVTLNPATHFRNVMSNTILLDLSGVDHAQQVRLATKAITEITNNTDDFQQARKYLSRGTMVKGEILDDMLRQLRKEKVGNVGQIVNVWNQSFGKATGVPAEIYQQEEFFFKYMKFIEQREKGMSVMKSVQEANKALFDYSDLTLFEKQWARRIMPFYTFPRKALPRILEAAADRPYVLAKYPLMASAMEKYALYNLDLDEKDYEQIKNVLPEYMSHGSYLLMPWRDANGDLQFFDWTYILPWGEMFDIQDRGLMGEVLTNPLYTVTAEIMYNRSGWSGMPIYQKTDTQEEKTFKSMLHVWQTLAPSLMYKGIYWDRIYYSVVKQTPIPKGGSGLFYDKVPPIAPAVAHTVFGLRAVPIDVEQERIKRIRDLQSKVGELEGKMKKVTLQEAGGAIESEEYERLRAQYLKQIEDLTTEGLGE